MQDLYFVTSLTISDPRITLGLNDANVSSGVSSNDSGLVP